MAKLKLTNLAAVKVYWQNIAAKHKEIDGYKWGDEKVITNDNRSDMPARLLWAQPYEKFRYNGEQSDNITKMKPMKVGYFLSAESELFQHIEEAVDKCEAVIEQIVAKLLMDKKGALNVAGEWEMISFRISSLEGEPVEMIIGSTRYIGCDLKIEFIDNTNLAYDASKWHP